MWVNHVLSCREMIMGMDNYGIIDASKIPEKNQISDSIEVIKNN